MKEVAQIGIWSGGPFLCIFFLKNLVERYFTFVASARLPLDSGLL